MAKTSFAIIASMVALLFVAGAMLQSLAVLQRVAAVSDLQGDVKLRPSGGDAYYPLADTRYVKAGDVIRTGEGVVTLNWVDGTRIKVGPASQLKVLKCQFNSATSASLNLFHLDVGRVWVRVLKTLSARSKFEIATPTATAGVRGTIFAVEVDSRGATEVNVLEGQVAVHAGGEDVLVDTRKAVRITPSGLSPGSPGSDQGPPLAVELAPMDQGELEIWKRQRDVIGPYLALAEPPGDRAPVVDGQIAVSGATELGAQLTVNGQPVTLGPRAKFRVLLPPPDGPELNLRVEAVDSRGERTVLERTLKVVKGVPSPSAQ